MLSGATRQFRLRDQFRIICLFDHHAQGLWAVIEHELPGFVKDDHNFSDGYSELSFMISLTK